MGIQSQVQCVVCMVLPESTFRFLSSNKASTKCPKCSYEVAASTLEESMVKWDIAQANIKAKIGEDPIGALMNGKDPRQVVYELLDVIAGLGTDIENVRGDCQTCYLHDAILYTKQMIDN